MNQKFLHHLGAAIGFMGLIGWFYAGRQLGIMEWTAEQMPAEYTGAGLMIAIIIVMTPGFFLWKLYNRWLENRLQVKGIYYEDAYYGNTNEADQRSGTKPNTNRGDKEGNNRDSDSDQDSGGNDGGDGGD